MKIYEENAELTDIDIYNDGQLVVTDKLSNTITQISMSSFAYSTIAGTGSSGSSAIDVATNQKSVFISPTGIAVDKASQTIMYVADQYRLRVYDRVSGFVDTWGGLTTTDFVDGNKALFKMGTVESLKWNSFDNSLIRKFQIC
jgi:hypothetical protein